MNRQLSQWFTRENLVVLTLGGWSSQNYVHRVQRLIEDDGQPAVLIYAGDFDPSGWFIPLDFTQRVGMFDEVRRIGVNPESINELGLLENPAPDKSKNDPRAALFVPEFGSVRQIEVDAIDVDALHDLYRAEVDDLTDHAVLDEVVNDESGRVDVLTEAVVAMEGDEICNLSQRARMRQLNQERAGGEGDSE